MRSAMSGLPGRTARDEIGDQRRAHLGPAAAAILEQEQRHFAEAVEIGAIDDRAATPLADGQVRRAPKSPDAPTWCFAELRSGGPVRRRARRPARAHQQPECIQARRLGKGRQERQWLLAIHTSRIIDIFEMQQEAALSSPEGRDPLPMSIPRTWGIEAVPPASAKATSVSMAGFKAVVSRPAPRYARRGRRSHQTGITGITGNPGLMQSTALRRVTGSW